MGCFLPQRRFTSLTQVLQSRWVRVRRHSACAVNSYPKGILALSPGLRGTSYPGKPHPILPNPNGVASMRDGTTDATPLG